MKQQQTLSVKGSIKIDNPYTGKIESSGFVAVYGLTLVAVVILAVAYMKIGHKHAKKINFGKLNIFKRKKK